jgi:diguanylate cyclase (GGDEF)-like protein
MSLLHFIADMPANQTAILDCQHDPSLVFLAYLVASAAGFTALAMANRVSSSRTVGGRELWRWIGAFALGGGIWSMHFIAMLSFSAPLQIGYNFKITLLSLLIAIVVSYAVMWVISRKRLVGWQYLAAAVTAGLGIATMHYSGMAAIESAATQYYDPLLFAVSVLIAIGASLAAVILAFYFRGKTGERAHWLRTLASLVMGGAIASMHFTGMAAMTLAVPTDLYAQVLRPVAETGEQSVLAISIGLIALIIIVAGIGASWADQRLREQHAKLRRVAQQLNVVTQYDPLTNLFNGRAFTQLATRAMSAVEPQQRWALLFIDLDNFKRINDSLGHASGDHLLQLVAQRIRSALGGEDVLARFSGDEFCVLAKVEHGYQAEQLASRIVDHLQTPFNLSCGQLTQTASIGLSVFPQDSTNYDALFKHAGLAVGYCKQNGRNRSLRFSPDLERRAHMDLTLEQDLRRALNEEGLHVHYQPIVSCETGQVISLEALARWNHPQRGSVSPEVFAPLAEQHGFIVELDLWVAERACRDLITLRQAGYPQLRVAFNCSALNLSNRALPAAIEQILLRTGLDSAGLVMEVTENALMSNLNTAVEVLEEIRRLGVRISIDDFGSGYSSLAYLRKLPVNSLKVDRSFIRDIPAEPNDMAITSAIIAMAHKLQLMVVAEGVESAEQLEFLRANDCDLIQGYLFSRPLTLEALLAWLAPPVQASPQLTA